MTKARKRSRKKELRLDEVTLLKLLRYDAEVRAAASTLALKQASLNEMLSKVDPKGVLRSMMSEVSGQRAVLEEMRTAYASIQKEAEALLGIDDLNEFAYDDKTGLLHPLPEAPKD